MTDEDTTTTNQANPVETPADAASNAEHGGNDGGNDTVGQPDQGPEGQELRPFPEANVVEDGQPVDTSERNVYPDGTDGGEPVKVGQPGPVAVDAAVGISQDTPISERPSGLDQSTLGNLLPDRYDEDAEAHSQAETPDAQEERVTES